MGSPCGAIKPSSSVSSSDGLGCHLSVVYLFRGSGQGLPPDEERGRQPYPCDKGREKSGKQGEGPAKSKPKAPLKDGTKELNDHPDDQRCSKNPHGGCESFLDIILDNREDDSQAL